MNIVQSTPCHSYESEEVHENLVKWITSKNNIFTKEEIEILCKFIGERSDFGFEKYKVRLCSYNGRDAEVDLQQELADAMQYLRQMNLEGKRMSDTTITLFKCLFNLFEDSLCSV